MIDKKLARVDASALQKDGDTMRFVYTDPFGQQSQGLLLRWRGRVRAYRNLCPHWSVELDHEGKFFDDTGKLLLCHHHGARFDPETGECVFGPSEGMCLEVFDVQPEEDGVHVQILRRVRLLFG